MNIVLGAGGQVGSQVAALLAHSGHPVRRVFHHLPQDTAAPGEQSERVMADYFDRESLQKAFQGGHTALLLTPESMASADMLADAKTVFGNYKEALKVSGIRRVVGLSSCGAQMSSATGTLQLYALLEETLCGLEMETYIVRPTYYYSNWMMYLDSAPQDGLLPTFFPPEQSIPMIAPKDVAVFLADVIAHGMAEQTVELTGPDAYTPSDIAALMGKALNRAVTAVQIPPTDWLPGLLGAGFSPSAAEYLLAMTRAVIDGKTGFTLPPVRTATTFSAFLQEYLQRG